MPEGRSLHIIAREIRADWKVAGGGVNPAAKPYLDAMSQLGSIEENYGDDSARSIVCYFLANASTWRGETARRIKAELNRLLG